MKSTSVIWKTTGYGTDLHRYMRIILALFWHEVELKRHAPLQVIVHLLEPMLVVATFMVFRYSVSASFFTAPYGTSLLFFYMTGFYPKYLFIFVSGIKARGQMAAPHLRFPLAQRLDYILVHVMIVIIEYAVVGIFVFGGLYFIGMPDAIPSNFSPVFLALSCSAMLGFGWGIMNLVIARFIWFWTYVATLLNRVLIIFAGAHFVIDFVPPNTRYLLSFNPEVHVISLFRTAFYRSYPTTVLDVGYMIKCSVAAVVLGLVLERVSRRAEGQ
jgi:capsular polysaccharide transport system permease protein